MEYILLILIIHLLIVQIEIFKESTIHIINVTIIATTIE